MTLYFNFDIAKSSHIRLKYSQKYVPIDLVSLLRVIASEAKQSLKFFKRLLRRQAPRNDKFLEQNFDNRCIYRHLTSVPCLPGVARQSEDGSSAFLFIRNTSFLKGTRCPVSVLKCQSSPWQM
jgi:hypothetical protein